jgi:hypothetical protein
MKYDSSTGAHWLVTPSFSFRRCLANNNHITIRRGVQFRSTQTHHAVFGPEESPVSISFTDTDTPEEPKFKKIRQRKEVFRAKIKSVSRKKTEKCIQISETSETPEIGIKNVVFFS